MPLKREVYPMTRLSIETPSSAEVVLRGLYRDIERRISASSPGLCPIDMSLSFLRLCHAQTCGKCVPCRIGLGQLATLIESVMNRTATLETIDRIERTAKVIADSADCAIGYEAAVMVLKGVKGFRDDYEEHILRGRCITGLTHPVPCVSVCPAHVDVPGYIALIREKRYDEAVALIRKDNPFPGVCGYVCEHPCEIHCRRRMVDDAVNICGLKRFAIDHSKPAAPPKSAKPTGRTVAIIGGGPTGIAAAYFLGRAGIETTIFEREEKLGGVPRYVIPAFRISDEAIDKDIALMERYGVEVKCGAPAPSVEDLKKNYENLNVSFDVWLGESDAQAYIPTMLKIVEDKHLAVESDGALVVPVQEETDTKEIPPCILLKSDGATLYATTDLATIVQRQQDFHPGKILYLTDKRQSLHFEQVFRVARKAELVPPQTELSHIGFGTMNGKDGKPFKTREGGVMRLEVLIREITDYVTEKIRENQTVSDEELPETAKKIAMAALKYGDLSNLATKDYVFDLDRFSSFEGNTGPYILYTIVRIKSILAKYDGNAADCKLLPPESRQQKDLMLVLSRLADSLTSSYKNSAPNEICAYIYELAGAANKFYHDVKIISEPDEAKKASYVALMDLTRRVLETCIDLLGFSAPEKM